MAEVATWQWVLAVLFVVGSAFCSGAETALTALGEARARQVRDDGGRRAAMLGLWIEHPERILSTLLIVNTVVNVGAGALGASIAAGLAAAAGWSPGATIAAAAGATAVAILLLGEIFPRTLAKRHPVRASLFVIPAVKAAATLLWPMSFAVTRLTGAAARLLGGAPRTGSAATSEELEYLIEKGAKEGVLDEVKEELLNSVLEFADRVAKEIMVPRTRVVAIDKDATPDELVRIVSENPYSRIPVYAGSIDDVAGILLVREIVGEVRRGSSIDVEKHLKPAFFVPEQMKISRLLKEMQRRKTHIAVVVDEFGGTSGIVTLEDVIEEIVGEIQDEADAETAPVKAVSPGVWHADAAIPLHDLEAFLNERPAEPGEGASPPPEIRFPERGDYETLGGFVTATAGRVPAVGSLVAWDGLTFTVRAADDRRVTRVEIARRAEAPGAEERARARG